MNCRPHFLCLRIKQSLHKTTFKYNYAHQKQASQSLLPRLADQSNFNGSCRRTNVFFWFFLLAHGRYAFVFSFLPSFSYFRSILRGRTNTSNHNHIQQVDTHSMYGRSLSNYHFTIKNKKFLRALIQIDMTFKKCSYCRPEWAAI